MTALRDALAKKEPLPAQPLTVNAAGKEQIIHIFRTGDSFAEVALASDKGYPADARVRVAQMSCLAGIGGRVKSLLAKAENAERILVVDGCPLIPARCAGFGPGVNSPLCLSRCTKARVLRTFDKDLEQNAGCPLPNGDRVIIWGGYADILELE